MPGLVPATHWIVLHGFTAVAELKVLVGGLDLEVEGRESALWTVRDGKVTRYAWFHGATDALEAVGLSE